MAKSLASRRKTGSGRPRARATRRGRTPPAAGPPTGAPSLPARRRKGKRWRLAANGIGGAGGTSLLMSAAIAYARRGIPVFPCEARGKRPRASERAARTWWERWPSANLGVPTGRRSRFLVLDVDPRAGGLEPRGARGSAPCAAPDDEGVHRGRRPRLLPLPRKDAGRRRGAKQRLPRRPGPRRPGRGRVRTGSAEPDGSGVRVGRESLARAAPGVARGADDGATPRGPVGVGRAHVVLALQPPRPDVGLK